MATCQGVQGCEPKPHPSYLLSTAVWSLGPAGLFGEGKKGHVPAPRTRLLPLHPVSPQEKGKAWAAVCHRGWVDPGKHHRGAGAPGIEQETLPKVAMVPIMPRASLGTMPVSWGAGVGRSAGLGACQEKRLGLPAREGKGGHRNLCYSSLLGYWGTGGLFLGQQVTRAHGAAWWRQACKSQGKGGIQVPAEAAARRGGAIWSKYDTE